jgi:hypothetical protein
MYYQDPEIELYTHLIEAKEMLLKHETDPVKIENLKMSIGWNKELLGQVLEKAGKRKEVRKLAEARVGKVTKLGEFEVTSNKLIITDPCYNKGTWCQGSLENAMPGKWHAYIQYRDEGDWGIRNSTIVAVHESCRLQDAVLSGYLYTNHLANSLDADIGVDSGQAGIFDWDKYPNEDPGEYGDESSFYGRICRTTLGDDEIEPKDHFGAGVVPEGCVTRSGDGDGGYRCFFNKNAEGKVDAVEISFYYHDGELEEDEFNDDTEPFPDE